MTKQADFKRRVRERMAKTGESYAAARARLTAAAPREPDAEATRESERLRRLRAALHVSNGDATDLAGTGLATRVIYWRDSLHEGPVPAVAPEELRRIRSDFLVRAGADERGDSAEVFAERDRALEANRDGEYVLWFEADLYDQLQIVQILSRLGELGVPGERITLICIGEHADIARFGGLGELSADQLAELPRTNAAIPLTPDALVLARRAWDAFRAPTPEELGEVVRRSSRELRFLGEAFDRLSREYPSTRDGLSLTERRILAAVADGARDAGTAFVRAASRETRPYLGDTWCFAMIERLAREPAPLVAVTPQGRVDRHSRLRLTDDGARVLAGEADCVRLHGVDRWIGGVHLSGHTVPWRWDEGTERLVQVTVP